MKEKEVLSMLNNGVLEPTPKEYNTLAGNLSYSLTRDRNCGVMIVSDCEGELTSKAIIELASAIAHKNGKVLIVGFNTTHKYKELLEISNTSDEIQTVCGIDLILPSGEDAKRLETILDKVKQISANYDMVLIDCPNFKYSSLDKLLFMTFDNALVLAYKWKSSYSELEHIVNKLKSKQKNVLGIAYIE